MPEIVTILTIDDDPSIRSSFREFLEDCEFNVLEAENGKKGIEIFKREKPDLVLVDLRMPAMGGIEVIEELSKIAPDTPIIVISGIGVIEEAMQAIKKGAWDYLLKPVQDLSVLLHAINKSLGRARLIRENRNYQLYLEDEVERRIREFREINEILVKEVRARKKTQVKLKQAEDKFESIVNFVPDIIYRLNPQGKISFINDAVKKYGYDPKELIGKDIMSIIYPEDLDTAKYCINERRTGNRRTTMLEVRLMAKNKSVIPFELQSSNVYMNPVFLVEAEGLYITREANQKTFIGTQGIARDITLRKKAEMELKRSEQNLAITLKSIGEAVVATDINGVITRMNPAAELLTGWKINNAIGKNVDDVIKLKSKETGEYLIKPFLNTLTQGRTFKLPLDTVLITKNNKEKEIISSSAPIKDTEDNIVGAVLVFRDVTEEMKIQEQLKHAQKMEAIGQLAGGVAHDFNNMLSGIIGAAELLAFKLTDADKKIKNYINLILETSERAAQLTQKLLTFSRKGRKQTVPINVNDIVKQVIGILEHSIDRKIKIVAKLTEDNPLMEGDPSQIQNAILNLAVNARDAMSDGGEIILSTSVVSLSKEFKKSLSCNLSVGEYIEIMVSDTGIGIPEEIKKNIFEPFFTTKEKGKGTGLGLAAVYGIVKEHHGCVFLDSVVGEGTTFTLLFPLSDKGYSAYTRSQKEIIKGEGCILLVDDEEILRLIAKDMMEDMGYKVITAVDGKEALEIFVKKKDEIDLVVVDLVMPRMDGSSLFYAMKKIKKDIKAIIVSGFNQNTQSSQQIIEAGALGYIQKPYRKWELSKILSEAMRS